MTRLAPLPLPVSLGLLGAGLALAGGASAALGHGLIAAAAVLAVVLLGLAAATFFRDPVRVLLWLWVTVVLVVPLSVIIGYESVAGQRIRQADEVLVLLLALLALWRAFDTDTKIPMRYAIPALLVGIFGAFGAVLHDVPVTVAVPGAWLGLKLWVGIVVAAVLPWTRADLTRVYKSMLWLGGAVAALGFAEFVTRGAILEPLRLQAIDLAPGAFRADAIHSIFFHPQQFSLFMGILFAVAYARFTGTRERSDLLFALLFAAAVLLSLRLKGILALSAVVLIVAFVQHWMGRRGGGAVALIGVAVVLAGGFLQSDVIRENVERYTESDQTARAQLYSAGASIASDNAPLGVGFGRYASYPSRINYSPVYDDYGLSSVYGLSRELPVYIDDTSWPSVIGETGYAGLLAYLAGVVLLIAALIRSLRRTEAAMRWVPLAALCALAVVLVDSIASPALFDWVPAISLALIVGPALRAPQLARRAESPDTLGRPRPDHVMGPRGTAIGH